MSNVSHVGKQKLNYVSVATNVPFTGQTLLHYVDYVDVPRVTCVPSLPGLKIFVWWWARYVIVQIAAKGVSVVHNGEAVQSKNIAACAFIGLNKRALANQLLPLQSP